MIIMGCCQISTPKLLIKQSTITSPSRMVQKHLIEPIEFLENYRFLCKTRSNPHYEFCECSHLLSGNIRSVKIYYKHTYSNKRQLEDSILKEIRILQTLDHPNIIKLLEVVEDNVCVYLVMEYFKLSLLFREISMSEHLSEEQIAEVMRQMLSILSYAHSMKVVIRNFSPENIILDSTSPSSFILKYIDFGCADFEDASVDEAMTERSIYSAPESAFHKKSDLWSCGVILYMLLTGKPPYQAPSLQEVREILNGSYLDHCSGLLKDFVNGLLSEERTRLTVDEALNHPWLSSKASYKTRAPHSVIVTVLGNLRNFQSSQKIKDLLKTFIANQLMPTHQIFQARLTFMSIDIDSDGRISKADLEQSLLRIMPYTQAENESEKILKQVDSDKNGFIEFSEYVRACLSPDALLNKHNLLCAFGMIDENRDNLLQVEELMDALSGWGNDEDVELWRELAAEIDSNCDGMIDMEEFTEFLLNKI